MSEGDTSGPDPQADTDGADQEDQRETIDPEVDLLHRYESIVQTQVDTLNGIDDKAAKTARLIGVLGGLVLTGTSLAASVDVLEVSSDTAVGLSLLLLGTAALFGSLVLSIITYLSTRFEYGPTATLGFEMATARIPEQLYRDPMLRGYSSAIQKNRKVVNANSTRFKLSLACFTVALILLFASGLALLSPGLYYDIGILLGGIILAFIVGRYIMGEHYLTIERE